MFIVIWGFGPVGTALLELFTLISTKPHRIFIFEPNHLRKSVALLINRNVTFITEKITGKTINKQMNPILKQSNNEPILLYDVTSGTDTLQFLKWVESTQKASKKPIFYINTSFESTSPSVDIQNTKRQDIINHSTVGQHRTALYKMDKPLFTCVVEAGMNPGLISHFSKDGILKLYQQQFGNRIDPGTMTYAKMAQLLNINAVLCTEKDTQEPIIPRKSGEFVNTWSVLGFLSEGDEVVQIGNHLPVTDQITNIPSLQKLQPIYYRQKTAPEYNCSRIYRQSGFNTLSRSVVPSGKIEGYVIPHGESDTLACYLTEKTNQKPTYRPFTYYVYQPCPSAIESIKEHLNDPSKDLTIRTLYGPDIKPHGKDEVGALIDVGTKGKWWYGTILSIEQTKALGFVFSGPTAVQVASSLYATALWILSNPINQKRGLLFPEQLNSQFILEKSKPFLGDIVFKKVE
jgi:homospermidine synthase